MLWFGNTLEAGALHFGIRIGVPVTEYFDTSHNSFANYTATTRRYVIGPALEWRARDQLAVSADVLFTRMGYVGYLATNSFRAVYDAKGDSWDVPIMVKARSRRRLSPYAGAGAVLRYVGPVRARGQLQTADRAVPIDTTDPSDLRKRFYPGIAIGGGLELRAGPVRIQPECRYTRWVANIAGEGGLVRFGPNQIVVILGVLR